jgi:hypothetical protein
LNIVIARRGMAIRERRHPLANKLAATPAKQGSLIAQSGIAVNKRFDLRQDAPPPDAAVEQGEMASPRHKQRLAPDV